MIALQEGEILSSLHLDTNIGGEINMDVYKDLFDRIDTFLNFPCEDMEGDISGGDIVGAFESNEVKDVLQRPQGSALRSEFDDAWQCPQATLSRSGLQNIWQWPQDTLSCTGFDPLHGDTRSKQRAELPVPYEDTAQQERSSVLFEDSFSQVTLDQYSVNKNKQNNDSHRFPNLGPVFVLDSSSSSSEVTAKAIKPQIAPLLSPTSSSTDPVLPFPSSNFISKEMENVPKIGSTHNKAHRELPCTSTLISPPMITLISPTLSLDPVLPFPSEELNFLSELRTTHNIPEPLVKELKQEKKKKNKKKLKRLHRVGFSEQSASKQTMPVQSCLDWKCLNCEKTKTRHRRMGPLGPGTLCDSCGSRYKLGLLKICPRASSTFATKLPSNSEYETSESLAEFRTTLNKPDSVAAEVKRKKVELSPMPSSIEQSSLLQTNSVRKCLHCQTRETPQWRLGPLGHGTLCDACGVHYKKTGTPSPDYHSCVNPAYGTNMHPNHGKRALGISSNSDQNASRSGQITHGPIATESKRKKVRVHIAGSVEQSVVQQNEPVQKGLPSATMKTPWGRMDPLGPKTLCNSYGIQQKGGGLILENRPTASPTCLDSSVNSDLQYCQIPSTDFILDSSYSGSKIKTMPMNPGRVFPGKAFGKCSSPATFVSRPLSPLMAATSSITDPVPPFPSSELFPKLENLVEFDTTPKVRRRGATKMKKKRKVKLSHRPSSVEQSTSQQILSVKKCSHCQITETPQWRMGPSGPKTLCNACGVRFHSGRLFPEYRPANSPTFVPTLHSNLHSKVLDMRTNQPGGIKIRLKIGKMTADS